MYAVNFTEMLAKGIIKADPSWPKQSCKNGWEYNFTEIPYSTIATEVGLKSKHLDALLANRNFRYSWTGSVTMHLM